MPAGGGRDYTSQSSSGADVKSYTPSSLGVNDTIISISQTGGNWGSNRFDVDGYTFVPNAKVLLNGGNNADYRLRVDGGIVTSALDLQYNRAPSLASNWFLGVQETNLEQKFHFYANVDAGNGQRTVSQEQRCRSTKTATTRSTAGPSIRMPGGRRRRRRQ